jgi:hypothetical protein
VDGGEARRILSHETEISGYSELRRKGRLLAEDVTPQRKTQRVGFIMEVFEEDLQQTRGSPRRTPKRRVSKTGTRRLRIDGSLEPMTQAAGHRTDVPIDDQYRKAKSDADPADGKVLA